MLGSGLISGLDTRTLVAQLGAVERQPARRLAQRQNEYRQQISSLGSLSSQMSDFRNALNDINSLSELLSSTASSSDEEVVTVEASGSAPQGSYSIRVDQLAVAEKNRSSSFAATDSEVRAGTLTIEVFGEDAVDVTIEDGDTLADVREKIAKSGALVDVSVIDTGAGARLSLTSQKSGYAADGESGLVDPDAVGGESNAVVITESYTGATGTELGMTEVETAQNAILEIDGLRVGSTSNRVSNSIEGVTLNLEATSATPVVVAIEPDTDATIENIKAVVDAYNTVSGTIKGYSDGSFSRSAGIEFASVMTGAVSGLVGEFGSLSAIGIKTDFETGQLTVDETRLREALGSDPEAVADVFLQEDTGIVDSMTTLIERYTDPEGIISNSRDGLNSRIDSLDSTIERINQRADRFEERMRAQFNSLETILNDLTNVSSQFASFVPAQTFPTG